MVSWRRQDDFRGGVVFRFLLLFYFLTITQGTEGLVEYSQISRIEKSHVILFVDLIAVLVFLYWLVQDFCGEYGTRASLRFN